MARLVKGSAVGLAMLASARWLWHSTRPADIVEPTRLGKGPDDE